MERSQRGAIDALPNARFMRCEAAEIISAVPDLSTYDFDFDNVALTCSSELQEINFAGIVVMTKQLAAPCLPKFPQAKRLGRPVHCSM
jgi:hypothetical protein